MGSRTSPGTTLGALPPEIRAGEDLAKSYARAGDMARAKVEAQKLERLAPKLGVQAYLAASRVYADASEVDLAEAVLLRAAAAARKAEDRRTVALARAQWLQGKGDTAALQALLTEWQKSDDPCLRAQAQRQLAASAT